MIQKKAPFSGMFTPQVTNGDCVLSRQLIGTILFGDSFRQLANGSGEVVNVIGKQLVNAGDLICEIDDDSVKCMVVNESLLSARLAKRIAARPKKKSTRKPSKKSSGKPVKKSTKKAAKKSKPHPKKAPKKITKSPSKKAGKRPAKKTLKKSTKKIIQKIIKPATKKAAKK